MICIAQCAHKLAGQVLLALATDPLLRAGSSAASTALRSIPRSVSLPTAAIAHARARLFARRETMVVVAIVGLPVQRAHPFWGHRSRGEWFTEYRRARSVQQAGVSREVRLSVAVLEGGG